MGRKYVKPSPEEVQSQIDICLNCTRPTCNYGDCQGLKDFTSGIHRHTSEDLDKKILKFFDACDTWVELKAAVKSDRRTIRDHAIALGLDVSKFSKGKKAKGNAKV